MRVTEITVTAGRTFNHPHETYSNLRPEVRLTATLDDTDDASDCAKALQASTRPAAKAVRRSMSTPMLCIQR